MERGRKDFHMKVGSGSHRYPLSGADAFLKRLCESLGLPSPSLCWLWFKATNTDMHVITHVPTSNTHTSSLCLATRFRFWKTLVVEEFITKGNAREGQEWTRENPYNWFYIQKRAQCKSSLHDEHFRSYHIHTGGSVNWISHACEPFGNVCITGNALSQGWATPLPGIYLEKQVQGCFLQSFVTVKNWKQHKCPSVGEWMTCGLFVQFNVNHQIKWMS